MSPILKILLLLMVSFTYSCKGAQSSKKDVSAIPAVQVVEDTLPPYLFQYDFQNPDRSIYLPVALTEISGITFDKEEKALFAIEDEDGIIYKIDLNGKVIEEYPFWKKGDYEGIILVKDTIFVVKSTGTIYKVLNLGEKTQYVEKYNTDLSKRNDVEGVTYDLEHNSLLLACKGKPYFEDDQNDARVKTIYEFKLDRNELISSPRVVLNLEAIQLFLKKHPHLKNWEKFQKYFGEENDKIKLSPSAVAIHPITGNLYVLSSSKKLILILDSDNNILHIEKLIKKNNLQPEGITFSKNGDLFISNEGKDLKATIHKYSYKN